MYRAALFDICLFPMEIVDLVLSYAPAPVTKCISTIIKHNSDLNKTVVGHRKICIIDKNFLIVYSGISFRMTQFSRCLPRSVPITMLENDNLLVLTDDSLVIYDTSINTIDEKVREKLDGIDKKYQEFGKNAKQPRYTKPISSRRNVYLYKPTCATLSDYQYREWCVDIDICTEYLRENCPTIQPKTIFQLPDLFRNIANKVNRRLITFRKNIVALACQDHIYIYKICNNDIQYVKTYTCHGALKIMFLKNPDCLAVLCHSELRIYGMNIPIESFLDNRKNYTQAVVSPDYDNFTESPDGKRIMLTGDDVWGSMIDVKMCIKTDKLPFKTYAVFEDNENIVSMRDEKIIKINRAGITTTNTDITERDQSPFYQLPDGNIFITNPEYDRHIPVLNNLNCEIEGQICGMLENGTIVSELEYNMIKFWGNA